MSMEAEVVAVGSFSRSIAGHLEYPKEKYESTRDGVPVLRILFHVHSGTRPSVELASCFGIEPWDFNQHHVDPMRADVEKLGQMFDAEEVRAFLALRDAGFQFYYMPNG
jgi:hypothetical protein